VISPPSFQKQEKTVRLFMYLDMNKRYQRMAINLLRAGHMTARLQAIFLSLLALCVAMSGLAPSAQAQAISGDLVGTVQDASGAALPNITVSATNAATNVKFTGVSNASGEYRIANLPPGTYDVSASAKGFATESLKGVAVELNRTTTANLKLSVSSVSTAIDVMEAGVLLDTTTAQVQQTYAAQQLQDLRGGARVQIAGRLIHEHQLWLMHQSPCNGDTLQFSAR
jgi:hypothetical protein